MPLRSVPDGPAAGLAALAAGCVLLTGCWGGPGVEIREGRSDDVVGSGVAASLPASDVLRAWDRDRARAYADGDVSALGRLYVAGSRAGTSDVRMLRDYLRRGLHVEGMQTQVLALEVLHEVPRRLRLLVTDRLTGAVAVGPDVLAPLPRDQASTRLVELRRAGAGAPWQVATVRGSSRRPAAR